MDLTFPVPDGYFNYRVCALLIHKDRVLAMKDARSPYYYLPGGRVKFGETAEEAITRELREELGVECAISRPLWLNQGFFEEDVSHERFHELCLYFLVDFSGTDLPGRGDCFEGREKHHRQRFTWLPFDRLEKEYLYPVFLKKEIFHLPESLTLRAEYE